MIRRLLPFPVALLALACGAPDPGTRAPEAGIRDVVILKQGSQVPLPFDPRGGRLTRVTGELFAMLGHPVVLELDTALSPEIAAHFEETVLASFETLLRELASVKARSPRLFAEAAWVERVVVTYDAVATESRGELVKGKKVLLVRAPPDRFPLLVPGVVTEAIFELALREAEARYGEASPGRLPESEAEAWFSYMTETSAWIRVRSTKSARTEAREKGLDLDDTLRLAHLERIARFGIHTNAKSALGQKVKAWLLEAFDVADRTPRPGRLADRADPDVSERAAKAYDAWLRGAAGSFDTRDHLTVLRVLERRVRDCGETCAAKAPFPSVDLFASGIAVHDDWVRSGAPVEPPATAQGDAWRFVVCPSARKAGSPGLPSSCSPWVDVALTDPEWRRRLAEVILAKRNERLLETVLLNASSRSGKHAPLLLDAVGRDERLFGVGARLLAVDQARNDAVANALEAEAAGWWRPHPSRRGLVLFLAARRWERAGLHYADSDAPRFAAEHGGPAGGDALARFFAFGPRSAELAPFAWKALARSGERDEGVARAATSLLDRDRHDHTTQASLTLARLRRRLCEEKNANGLATLRAELERWARAHPDDTASVANAIADATLAKCPRPDAPVE